MRIPKRITIREKDIPRFWEKVNKHSDGCWEWNAYVSPNGHGRFSVDGISRYAHRFSYVLHKGEIPAGLFVRHLCNNPSCVNPLHLDIISSLPLVDLAIIGYGLVAVPLACVAVVAVWKRGNRSE